MNCREYESAKNLTLLFFLDRIVEKGQPRTLHDLSCQFGTKGFTKQMRQIAGGSQTGLRKFLENYPSLFTIRGDDVDMTDLSKESLNHGFSRGPRDYAEEAAEYFKVKLKQYGVGTEVPIMSLLGHRSQAPPEVRHVSGQNAGEFQSFLEKFPDIFLVNNGCVLLKEDEYKERRLFHEQPVASIDECLTRELVQFVRTCLSLNGPSITEQLFSNICSYFEYEQWSLIFKNPQDLTNFLKLYSNTFSVHGNLVTLVPCKQRHASTSDSSRINTSAPCYADSSPKTGDAKHLSLKQRVGNIILKTMSQNNELCQLPTFVDTAPLTPPPPQPPTATTTVATAGAASQPVAVCRATVTTPWRLIADATECRSIVDRLLAATRPVGVDAQLVAAAAAAAAGGGDAESGATVALLQLADWSGQVFVCDVAAGTGDAGGGGGGDLMQDGGLLQLLQSQQVVKVFHDCRNFSAALFANHGVRLNNIFDTQAAHAVLQQQLTGKHVYKVKSVSLSTLCDIYGAPIHPDRERVRKMSRRDARFWLRRPLTDEMWHCCVTSVASLVPSIYSAMSSAVDDSMRQLLAELCGEQVEARISELSVRHSRRRRKVAMEVAELQCRLAASQGARSLVLTNREIRLLRHLELTDEQKDLIEKSYKVAKKLDRLQQRRGTNESGVSPIDEDRDEDDNDDDYDGEEYSSEQTLDHQQQRQQRPLSSDQCPTSLDSCADLVSSSGTSSLTATDSATDCLSTASVADSVLTRALADSCRHQLHRISQLELALTATAAAAGQLELETGVQTGQQLQQLRRDTAVQTLSTGEVVITQLYDGF